MNIPEFSAKNKWFWAALFFPLIIDFINVRLYDQTVPAFIKLFNSGTDISGWIIIALYVLYILSLLTIGWLTPYKKYSPKAIHLPVSGNYETKRTKTGQYITFISSAGFGIIVMMLIMHSSGLYDEMINTTSSELSKSKEWVTWIGIALYFVQLPAAMGFSPKYRIGSFNYFAVYSINVIIAAILVVMSTAAFSYFFASDNPVNPNRTSKFIEFIAFFIFYFFFLASPRLIFMSRNFSWLNFTSAIISMSWFLWKTLDFIEL